MAGNEENLVFHIGPFTMGDVTGIYPINDYYTEEDNLIPESLRDLGDKKYLSIFCADGQTYQGTDPFMTYVNDRDGLRFLLKIQLLGGGEKVFDDAATQITAVTRHT